MVVVDEVGNSSQAIMSSCLLAALNSIDRNNEFRDYESMCSDWKSLQIILKKYLYADIQNQDFQSNIKYLEHQNHNLNDIEKKIKFYCKQKESVTKINIFSKF